MLGSNECPGLGCDLEGQSPRGGQGALPSPVPSRQRSLAAASELCWVWPVLGTALCSSPAQPSTTALALHTNRGAPLFALAQRKQSSVSLFCVYLFLLSSAFRQTKFISFLGPRIWDTENDPISECLHKQPPCEIAVVLSAAEPAKPPFLRICAWHWTAVWMHHYL